MQEKKEKFADFLRRRELFLKLQGNELTGYTEPLIFPEITVDILLTKSLPVVILNHSKAYVCLGKYQRMSHVNNDDRDSAAAEFVAVDRFTGSQ